MSQHLKLSEVIKLSKDQITKFKKDDLVNLLHKNKEFEEFTDLKIIQESINELKNNIIAHILEDNKKLHEKVEILEENNFKLENCMKTMEKKFHEKVEILEENNFDLENWMNTMEKEHWRLNQYSRKNNVEISGIPESIEDLEECVVKVINKIGVECSSDDIEACHRLPHSKFNRDSDAPKRTIVRFVNRKLSESALGNRKKLKDLDLSTVHNDLTDKRLFINDNLCPYYKGLYGKCRRLYDAKLIHSFWSWKGGIFFKKSENSRITEIYHDQDLFEKFKNFDFDNRFLR